MTGKGIERALLRLAGFLGIDPRPFTFRQLFIMAEGRRAEEWVWWSEMLALTANCHRDPKASKPITSESIHPYRPKPVKGEKGSVRDVIATVKARYGGVKGGTNGER